MACGLDAQHAWWRNQESDAKWQHTIKAAALCMPSAVAYAFNIQSATLQVRVHLLLVTLLLMAVL